MVTYDSSLWNLLPQPSATFRMTHHHAYAVHPTRYGGDDVEPHVLAETKCHHRLCYPPQNVPKGQTRHTHRRLLPALPFLAAKYGGGERARIVMLFSCRPLANRRLHTLLPPVESWNQYSIGVGNNHEHRVNPL